MRLMVSLYGAVSRETLLNYIDSINNAWFKLISAEKTTLARHESKRPRTLQNAYKLFWNKGTDHYKHSCVNYMSFVLFELDYFIDSWRKLIEKCQNVLIG